MRTKIFINKKNYLLYEFFLYIFFSFKTLFYVNIIHNTFYLHLLIHFAMMININLIALVFFMNIIFGFIVKQSDYNLKVLRSNYFLALVIIKNCVN